MAAGDLLILTNSNSSAVLPNAGTNLDLTWDTISQSFGLGAGNASVNGRVSLAAGRYLVIYSEYFTTTNTTNNERIEAQGEIHTTSGGVQGGYGQGYIRKSSGDQQCVVRGSMILDLASADDVFIRTYRTDNSTSGTVNRDDASTYANLIILELDTGNEYGLYSKSATQNLTGTTTSTVSFPNTDVQDTNFSIASNVVTVTNAGRYLVTYSVDLFQTATGREDIIGFLRNNGTEITGTRSFCYLRGSDGTQDGALSWIGILDLPAGATIDLRAQCPTSATISLTQGTLHFWRLPAAASTVILEATNGSYNTNGNFTFDTVPHIDTDEFTASGATNSVTLDNGNAYLAFATLAQFAPDTPQRAVPRIQIQVDGVNQPGVGDGYHRNSGGTGFLAINTAAGFFADATNLNAQLNITVTAAAGTLTNDSAQFSLLSLASIFGLYTPPPVIFDVDGDNQILTNAIDVAVTGVRFGAIQGTGKLEFWSDVLGTTKVVQTIDSWSDTAIQFDFVQGSLTDQSTIYAVVTTDTGDESPTQAVFLGVAPLDDYFTIYDNTNPDHWWRFNNDGYADSAGANPITSSVVGDGGAFVTTPICEQNTHSWRVTGGAGSRRECANSNNINGEIETTRTMAGWIRVGSVDPALSCIYEEGGGVNNMTLLLGMGNTLLVSYADTGDDNAQAYSDKPLDPDRDYFYTWQFDHNGDQELKLFLDGVRQAVDFGNPLTSGDLDSHSGDISFGGPGGSLEVGGTDVTFRTQLDTYYANWASWTVALSDADILELFRRGARPVRTVASDTPANMQTALDAFADSVFPNEASSLRIFNPSSAVIDDLALDLDNIVFDEDTSIQVEWRGAGVLTLTNLNGSNVDASKCYSSRGGSVNVVNPATLTLTGLQNPTEVRVYEAGTQTEIAGQEDVTTGTFSATIQTPTVDIVIAALTFQNIRLLNVDTTNDVTLPIQQRFDRYYENP